MRRLARHAFTALSALSLLLCVAVLVLWLDSNFTKRTVTWLGSNRAAEVKAQRGTLYVVLASNSNGFGRRGWDYGALTVPPWWRTFTTNFEWFRFERTKRRSEVETAVAVPLWFVCIVSLIVPGYGFARRSMSRLAKGRRAAGGKCPQCGYDLRASPGRCPECGAAAA